MARNQESSALADTAALLVQLHAHMSGKGSGDLSPLIPDLLASASDPLGQLRQPSPSRRGRRRKTVVTQDPYPLVARILDAIGWRDIDGTRMTPAMAREAAAATSLVLRQLGAFTNEVDSQRWDDIPTPQGALFARAALRTWLSPA
jgi:hypothetical protein